MARKGLVRHQNPDFPDIRDYVEHKGASRPTAQMLADAIDMTLGRAQVLIREGWTAGDLLMVSEALGLNPVVTLVDYGYVTATEAVAAARNLAGGVEQGDEFLDSLAAARDGLVDIRDQMAGLMDLVSRGIGDGGTGETKEN